MGAELMGKDRRCLSCNSNKQQTAQLPGVSARRNGAGTGRICRSSARPFPPARRVRRGRARTLPTAPPAPSAPWRPRPHPPRLQRGRQRGERASHRFRARHTACPLAHTSGTQTHGIQLQIKVTKFKRTASSSVV